MQIDVFPHGSPQPSQSGGNRNHAQTKWQRWFRRSILALNLLVPLATLALWLSGHPWLGLSLLPLAHVLFLIPTLIPANAWCGPVITHLDPSQPHVWLTIDDGPDPIDTPLLLDLLDTHHAKATFFFIGAKARQHPHLVPEVIRRGHTLGNHTMTHPQYSFWSYLPFQLRREILTCQQTLTELAPDHPPLWFRAPAGLKNPFTHPILQKAHLHLACWNARGLDGVERDPAKIIARLQPDLRPGAIILMHEARLDLQGNRLAPQVLEAILQHLSALNLKTKLP